MAHSIKRNDKFNSTNTNRDNKDSDLRRTQPYRRTKFRIEDSSIDD